MDKVVSTKFLVIKETKQDGYPPHSKTVEKTEDFNFLDVLDAARDLARMHAHDCVVEEPYRFNNGFQFHTSNNTRVTYRVEVADEAQAD